MDTCALQAIKIIHVLPYQYLFVLVAVPCWSVVFSSSWMALARWSASLLSGLQWLVGYQPSWTGDLFLGCLKNAVPFVYSSLSSWQFPLRFGQGLASACGIHSHLNGAGGGS